MGFIDSLQPLFKMLPEVKVPEVKPPLKKRLLWTGVVLVLFYIMGNISLIGIAAERAGEFEQMQLILASDIGTLLTLGIGPIVLASIILQLLVGAGFLKIDLTNAADRTKFTSLQKLAAIILSFFEAGAYVLTGFLKPAEGMLFWVILQVAIGAIILMYLDEVVSKYGIGSGIGLFIAGGVAASIFWAIFNPLNIAGEFDIANGAGLLFVFIRDVNHGLLNAITFDLLPIVFTIIVFFIVVFFEGMHVNIPITMGYRGAAGRFPIKFLYVSNIPVILAVALFANIRLWALLAKDIPLIGGILTKLSALVIAPHNLLQTLFSQLGTTSIETIFSEMVQSIITLQSVGLGGQILHAFAYITILVVVCVIFGKFWVEISGQGAEAVAEQLQRAGMYVPGFRRDPRIVRKILDRYIPPITILGSAFVGLLAGFADLTGALGSGTGILLTVGIVYRLYEELARYQIMESHPLLAKLFK